MDVLDDETSELEAAFHSAVREYIICLLIFLGLYGVSFVVIRTFKTRTDKDDLYAGDEEDYLVYRISVWISTFSLAVSLGAVLLLPFSIVGNELHLHYPNSWYIKWLTSSLIQSLWNHVFMLSNLCLFFLLPFAYFFIESQGFSGLKKGVLPRVYEALSVSALSLAVFFCLAHLVAIWLDPGIRPYETAAKRIWNYQLPFIYSCVSLFGVFMLLTCTPIGFARIFVVVGGYVVKPRWRNELELDLLKTRIEESTLQRRAEAPSTCAAYHQILPLSASEPAAHCVHNRHGGSALQFRRYPLVPVPNPVKVWDCPQLAYSLNGAKNDANSNVLPGEKQKSASDRLAELTRLRIALERQRTKLLWLHNLKYPVVMVFLLALTAISLLMVVCNVLQLLVGLKALPNAVGRDNSNFGNASLSLFGSAGALMEIAVIFYVMSASLVGLYSVPILRRLRPRRRHTSMTKVLGNCSAVLILSSALPVLTNTLGFSSFDLLGAYGKIDWLGNLYLVLSYNVAFAAATALCLAKHVTSNLTKALRQRFNEAGARLRRRHRSTSSCEDNSTKNASVAAGTPSDSAAEDRVNNVRRSTPDLLQMNGAGDAQNGMLEQQKKVA